MMRLEMAAGWACSRGDVEGGVDHPRRMKDI